jgi:myo-inositol-1(or 4)-monophosphatase
MRMATHWLDTAQLALQAVTESAQVLENALLVDTAVKVKESRRDVVTQLDMMIEKNIIKILKPSGYPVMGEETRNKGFKRTYLDELMWFVDPIDGTANFIAGIPFYAVSVGLARKNEFRLGAVVLLDLKEIFFTFGDKGAYLNGKCLKVKASRFEDALLAASFSGKVENARGRDKEYGLFGKFNDTSRGCLRLGSAAINICYVAAGRLQGAYGISAKIWDVAGALAVASQAGCKIYVEWIKDTNKINYVVGVEGVAERIAQKVMEEGLADLKEIVCV